MDITAVLLSSALISAVVGGLISYLSQRRILDRKAQVDYDFNARKRLYEAIGPLRLQLLFSANDLEARIAQHAARQWHMRLEDYYARSFIYRLLRPLALGQIIEERTTMADFSVDAGALALLHFNATIYRMMADGKVLLGHPGADWATQTQHLFWDNLRATAATLLIAEGDDEQRVMSYARFAHDFPDPLAASDLHDLAAIFAACDTSLLENPIFWLRLVGYGYACHDLVTSQGSGLGFEAQSFNVPELLDGVGDEFISRRVVQFEGVYQSVVTQGF